jgi:hypothetical protein
MNSKEHLSTLRLFYPISHNILQTELHLYFTFFRVIRQRENSGKPFHYWIEFSLPLEKGDLPAGRQVPEGQRDLKSCYFREFFKSP